MKILMLSNSFTPHVGGVARSVARFAAEFRRGGHRVLVVAPTFNDTPADEPDVVRIPAIQRFNGSDFSLPMPIPGFLRGKLDKFGPEVVHSHHPFLLGDTALRISAAFDIPIIFTHHTQYEQYTHYVPGDSPAMRRFAVQLSLGYCNLCDAVIAPSETIEQILRKQGVEVPIEVVPTGVDIERFSRGDGSSTRRLHHIPKEALVVGHVGRLAPEKNLAYLAEAVAQFMTRHTTAWFLVVGVGPAADEIQEIASRYGVADRLVRLGILSGDRLSDAYHAMDVFAFASQSETQGMVLTEAMAAGVPVVAVDAPGVREVVRDGTNGRLLACEYMPDFVAALEQTAAASRETRDHWKHGAKETARHFSMARSADRALKLYQHLIDNGRVGHPVHSSLWQTAVRRIGEEWKIWSNVGQAVENAIFPSESSHETLP